MQSAIDRAPARAPGRAALWAGAVSIVMLLSACGGGAGGGNGTSAPAAGFSVTAAPASLTVGQGQEALIEVTVQRDAGFTEPVNLALSLPPAGITADPLVLPASQTRGLLSIRVSADLAAGTVLKLDVTGTAAGTSRAASSNLTVSAPQAYAQAMIATALDAGTLDHGTALLYRAYALLGDKRLPNAYLGAGSADEDNLLFDEIRLRFASSPVAAQDALRPFIVRPTDPISVWNAPAAAGIGRAKVLRETRQAVSPTSCATATMSGTWISKRSASHPVRVWAQCHGEAGFDAQSVSLIDKTLVVLDKVFDPMTRVMGQPLLDLEGGDNAIDFYIVDDGSYVYRRTIKFQPVGLGSTYPDYAETPTIQGNSGFVTLPRWLLYTSRFHNTVIHEFFHVMQKAHNAEFSSREVAGKPNARERHWFVEASATWASAHFDRTLAPWPDGRGAYVDAHRRFKEHFLPSFDALNAIGSPHDYSAYIWPYFVEQESGGSNFMKNIWIGLEAANTFEEADKVIDKVYPFAANFKRFALRNINTELMPGDPLPKAKRHVNLDPDQFADDKREPPYQSGTLVANQEYSQDFELKNLSARYVRLNVSQEGTAVRKVTVDVSGLQPASELDVQALVRTDDGWLAQPVDITPDNLVFCFDKGPTTAGVRGSFKEILLIVSNHAIAKGGDISGTLKVQPKSLPCATLWEGTINQVVRSVSAVGRLTITTNANVSFEFDDAADATAGEVPFRLRSGTFTYDLLSDNFGRNPPCRGIGKGAGALPLSPYQPLVPSGTSARLSIFPEALQYGGSGISVVTITNTDNCNDRGVDVVFVDPIASVVWWNEPNIGEIAADGKSIRQMYTAPNGVSYDIRLDKKTEGD